MPQSNQDKNKAHYEKLYDNYSVSNIVHWVNNLDKFLTAAIATETSWQGLYQNDLRQRLSGKRVLEMGCGDCVNAAMMAALGAKVYANDIASASGRIIEKVNEACNFAQPIEFVAGDFLENNLAGNQFDFVIGKAFLHHLTIPVEREFLKETARLLKSDGEARFFEPAVNSKILDEIRWHIPIGGRPSKFNKTEFKIWKENDPHPDRTFSSAHFEKAGQEFFGEVKTIPVGTLERFNKLFPKNKFNYQYRRWAFRAEKKLPGGINKYFTRSQSIIYREPVL
tara:strand:+ start:155 stop:997 length:843 start_codon:yes stop_codon:yes gene_type:complete